jgi:hypothetical protein
MSSVAPYSHERDQLVNVRSRQWIVNGVCLNALPPSILSPIFDPPDKLNSFFGSMRSGATFTADVKNIQSCFRFGIEEDKSLRVFASEKTLAVFQMVAKEAAQEENFALPTNMRVPEASIIYRLLVDEMASDRAGRKDLGNWSDSKGKRLEGRAVVVEGRKVEFGKHLDEQHWDEA